MTDESTSNFDQTKYGKHKYILCIYPKIYTELDSTDIFIINSYQNYKKNIQEFYIKILWAVKTSPCKYQIKQCTEETPNV